MDAEEKQILDTLDTLPMNITREKWVKMMVAAWNEADRRSEERCQAGLIVRDVKILADAISLADKRYTISQYEGPKPMGGRHSRVEAIQRKLAIAMEYFWKLEFHEFEEYCNWIESGYRKSTVYEALRKLGEQGD
jgi:hypothetical protein